MPKLAHLEVTIGRPAAEQVIDLYPPGLQRPGQGATATDVTVAGALYAEQYLHP
ncbi:hypothetical protein D3C72_2313350 [compost metagenome]